MGFTGKSTLKTTIPNKPTPTGFKVWAVAESGLILRWNWHIPGKGPVGVLKNQESAKLNPTQRVVTHLVWSLPKAPYHVFLDNLFSSPTLFKVLRNSGIGASGTARTNSGIFQGLVDEKKKPDPKKPWGWIQAVPTPDSQVNQFAWKDSDIVLFISTIFAYTETTIIRRRRPAKANTQAKKKAWEAFEG